MTRLAREEYAAAVRARYRAAGKKEKGRLLDEFCRTTGGHQPRRAPSTAARLARQIPLRTFGEWQDVAPGSLQGDLVLHCGESTAGFCLSSLVGVDVATSWTELEAVWGLGHRRVGSGVHHLRQRLPFPKSQRGRKQVKLG